MAAATKAGDEGVEAKLAKGETTEAWERKGGGDGGGRRKCGNWRYLGGRLLLLLLLLLLLWAYYGLGNGTGAGGCEREGSAHRHTQYMST